MSSPAPERAGAAPALRIRKPAFRFDDVPRHWFHGSPVASHLVNGLNLIFPAGERFFIRSVRRYLDRIDDPALLAEVRAFIGQETRHGMEHERYFGRLEEQGYAIRSFLAWYERVAYGIIEPLAPAELRLSTTAALEHFTAMFAERALNEAMLDNAHPAMQDLLRWHACEELEHKAVAFEVLQRVNPSYALRVAGLAVGTSVLVLFWLAGAAALLRQEPPGERVRPGELREVRQRNPLANGDLARAFLEYLEPGFHPDKKDNRSLAAAWLAENAARLGISA